MTALSDYVHPQALDILFELYSRVRAVDMQLSTASFAVHSIIRTTQGNRGRLYATQVLRIAFAVK